MIPVPSGVRVWLAVGHTDMRRGMNGLALQVQQALGRDPHAGDLYVFRGRRADLVKIIWHDGIGMSLYAKRLERGRFLWPSPADGCVAISGAQLAYMLDGIDWRNPQRTWLSIGTQTGPRIGVQKGPPFDVHGRALVGRRGAVGAAAGNPGVAAPTIGAQTRFLNRQLSLPVSTMSRWCVRRSSRTVVIFASPNTLGHSPKARLVVTSTEVCS
jgi:transposase